MALELAEVAAGLPMAASFALAGGITTLREGRRRSSLNAAIHELRRPLQVLSLSLPDRLRDDAAVDSSLRLAAAALDHLDREINGTRFADPPASLAPRPLLEEAVRRWQAQAVLAGDTLRLRWAAGEPVLMVRPMGFSQAVDNLISNALEHGGGEVTIDVREGDRFLAISVRDSGTRTAVGARSRSATRHDPRRGHGLRLVAHFAESHGGSFDLQRGAIGAEAVLRLPLTLDGGRR
ncbi:MAG: sensor histidine kinase [Solirubrobacterales bacterium]